METYKDIADELFQKANNARDIARLNPDKIELYIEASENFKKLSSYYNKLITDIEKQKNIPDFVREVFVAEKEHVDYEHHLCLFMLYNQKDNFKEAEYHFLNMKEKINSAYQRMINLSKNSLKPEDKELDDNINEDTLTWEYFCLQLDSFYYSMRFRKAFTEENYLEALDYIRICIEELNLLKEKLPKYVKYIGYEYKRVINANYFAMCSNEQLDVVHSLIKNEVSIEVLKEIIRSTWKAYEFTLDAVRENPIQNYNDILKKQQELILEFLENTKNNWDDLFITFEDNKEFLKMMKKVDPKRFNLVKADLIYEENKTIRYWSIGSLLVLIFLTIATTITIIATKVTETWLVIPIFLSLEATFIIVSSFLIRATGTLSDAGLIELVRTAFQFQTLVFKANKKQGSNSNNVNNETNIEQ